MGKDMSGKQLPPGITQRKDGLYMGRVTYHGTTHTIYNKRLPDLKREMTDLRHGLEHGTFIKDSKITFSEWFDEWIDTYKRSVVKAGTIDGYKKHFRAYLKEPLGNMRLTDIRAEHLQKLLNKMAKDGYSDNTIDLCSCILSGTFKQAYKNELIPKNPFLLITKPKGKAKKERVVFTKEQQEIYMEYAERSYLCNLFQLAICTGMRNAELGGLLWSDVDFKNRVIHVRHNLVTTQENGTIIDTPKTKTSERDIPMIDKAYMILKRQEKEYREAHGSVRKIVNNDFVFSVFGDPISKKRITHEIEVMLDNMKADGIDFPYFTLHSTRHTFATRCIENGMQPKVLQHILGHATLSMTMDLYGHVLPDTKIEAMQAVASAF